MPYLCVCMQFMSSEVSLFLLLLLLFFFFFNNLSQMTKEGAVARRFNASTCASLLASAKTGL